MTKYLLVRPESGLNDMLTQIEVGCLYGQNSGRVVVVDTNHSSSKHFRDDFSHYFVSIDPNLHLSVEPFVDTFDRVSVYPSFLAGRVSNYDIENSEEYSCWVETVFKQPIRIDFTKEYSETLLVHQLFGGNPIAINALQRMRLQPWIVDELHNRLQTLPEEYSAIHIRNTDIKTDYNSVLHKIDSHLTHSVLFVATDSREVLEAFINKFGNRIASFTTLPEGNNALHYLNSNPRVANTDAILDLLTLACSAQFFMAELHNCNFAKVSGYSTLARNLNENRDILARLISDERIITST